MRILELDIDGSGVEQILEVVETKIQSRNYFSFLNVNAHIVSSAHNNSLLKKDLSCFSKLFSDGTGIYLASLIIYGKEGIQERITGTDLYYSILRMAEEKGYSVCFFGGDITAIGTLEKKLRITFPKIIIKGIEQRDLTLSAQIADRIANFHADILFLGLGTPYQEKWIATFGSRINTPIQIAVGSGIDFLAGAEKRAPKILRDLGLEWFFRMIQNPKRLWKRYLLGIPKFSYLIIMQTIKNKIK